MAPARAIAYVEDPLDAFFLQIQGSGRIALADGGILRLGYADQNGHPYRAIANVLIERGEMTLAEASLQAIRAWGARNPARLPALLDENPSYVFFREISPAAPGDTRAGISGGHRARVHGLGVRHAVRREQRGAVPPATREDLQDHQPEVRIRVQPGEGDR